VSAFLSVGVDGAGNVYPATLTAYPAAAASGAGANLTIAPQAATTTGASGSVVINVSAEASGTTEAGLIFERASTPLVKIQGLVSSATTYWSIYPGGVVPGTSNYQLAGSASGTVLFLNASTTVYMSVAGTPYVTLTASNIAITAPIGGGSSLPLQVQDNNQTLAASGTTTLSAANQAKPSITFAAVTLTGAATFAFGNIGGAAGTSSAIFYLDISGINAASLATYGLTLSNGTGTITLTSTQIAAAGGLILVKCNANAITIG
jgi:hypothetical protein